MSKMDELIANIDSKKRNPKNTELWELIQTSLEQINEINESYKKLKEGNDVHAPILRDIEEKYIKIQENYDNIFLVDENGKNKSQEINDKIKAIRQYHKELLEDSEESKSIKFDISESQKYITEFYNFLFGDDDDQDNAEKIKKSIADINQFYLKVFNEDNGIEKEADRIYASIVNKYSELFDKNEEEKSKIQKLDENISNISLFNESLEKKIKPNLDQKQEYLNKLQIDINTKSAEISSLLSDATARSLAEGYLESMHEYSKAKPIHFKNKNGEIINSRANVFFHNFSRHIPLVINYCLFIFPLILASLIFVGINFLEIIHGGNIFEAFSSNSFKFSLYKLSISLPLLWISWYGQRNISQRKRLFEEYNHKLRVVQMYIMFNSKDKTYNLQKRDELEKILLEVIGRNPSETFGKDETMLDKIFNIFRLKYNAFEDKINKMQENFDKFLNINKK